MDVRLEKLREEFLSSAQKFVNEENFKRICDYLRNMDESEFLSFWSWKCNWEKELEAFREDQLSILSKVYTKEKYEQVRKAFTEMSLFELYTVKQWVDKEDEKYEKMSDKERLNLYRDVWEKNIGSGNRAADTYKPIEFFSESETKKYLDIINQSYVQDYIYLTAKEDRFLIEIWEGKQDWDIDFSGGENRGTIFIPSDLFFAKTIPLRDCVIEVDERNDFENGKKCKGRVIVFDDYKSLIDNAIRTKSEDQIEIGIFVYYIEETPIMFSVFGVCPGIDVLVYRERYGFFPGIELNTELTKYDVNGGVLCFLETWYGIQIALLHPDVQDVFKNPQRAPTDSKPDKQKKRKRRIVRYVRKHFLNIADMEECAHTKEAEKTYHRKCLVWHVIGHWRTYKNGTKIFIQPYWKGVLRKVKKACDVEPRSRELSYDKKTIGSSS